MKEYILSDGAGTQAVILPEKGATVTRLVHQGVDFLYQNAENLASAERPRCGIPFLFPMFGRLQDGLFHYEGKQYPMDIHGFAHTSQWEVVSHRTDALVLTLTDSEETRKQYPFRFRVTLTYEIKDGYLSISQCYENLDEVPMPYSYGFHPYFYTEELSHVQVEATAAQQISFDYKKENEPTPFGHGFIGLSIPDGSFDTGKFLIRAQSPTILHIPDEGRRITLEYDDSLTRLVLWTMIGGSFLCVEPVNGVHNGLNTGDHLILEPGQKQQAVVRIRPECI